MNPPARPCIANVLARESGRNDRHFPHQRTPVNRPDVAEIRGVRIPLRENLGRFRVHLGDVSHLVTGQTLHSLTDPAVAGAQL